MCVFGVIFGRLGLIMLGCFIRVTIFLNRVTFAFSSRCNLMFDVSVFRIMFFAVKPFYVHFIHTFWASEKPFSYRYI